MKHYEKELPEGYREVYSIDATSPKVSLILNLVVLVLFAALFALALVPFFVGAMSFDLTSVELILSIGSLIYLFLYIAYIVGHELVHGAAYKALTGEKLTYGFSATVAYCGVPNVYVYRKASLIALLAPFVVFTILFGVATVICAFVNSGAYIVCALLLVSHLAGCVGDLFVTFLFLTRFKSEDTLMRDTGPKQTFYLKFTEQQTNA